MAKDWTGNSRSAHAMLGARNYALQEREKDDYYATEPKAARLLMSVEKFSPVIWEPACGEGHLSKEFEKAGYTVFSSDLVDRGYGQVQDFLTAKYPPVTGADIVTNPPYSKATEFVNHALDIIEEGRKAAMFLKIQFLESQKRYSGLFKNRPPVRIYVSVKRLRCALGGSFDKYAKSNAIAYGWFVWQKGFAGDPIVKWINFDD